MGGTEVTITGKGFGTDKEKLNVEFGEFECKVKTVSDTEILCDTEPALNIDQLWSDYSELGLSFHQSICVFINFSLQLLSSLSIFFSLFLKQIHIIHIVYINGATFSTEGPEGPRAIRMLCPLGEVDMDYIISGRKRA